MFILLFILPVIICVAIAVKKKKSFYTAMLLSCIGCAIGIGLCLLYIYAMTGMDVVSYNMYIFSDAMKQEPEMTKMIYAQYVSMNNLSAVSDVNNIDINSIMVSASDVDFTLAHDTLYDILAETMVAAIPGMLVILATWGALGFYLVPRAISKKTGGEVGYIPPFGDWRLPSFFGWGSLGLLAVCIIMYAANLNNYDLVINIAYVLLFCIYTVQGMAVIEFMLKRKFAAKGPRVGIMLLIIFLAFLIWPPLFMLIGIIEQIANIRKKNKEKTKYNG